MTDDVRFLALATDQALKSRNEGGIPIGSVLVRGGQVVAEGHNKRVQEQNPMVHAEIDCLINAGRMRTYSDTTLYSTLMPCYLCAGAVVQFGIPRVVVGEETTFEGARAFMEEHGVEVVCLDSEACVQMMQSFIATSPELWNEDIGVD
jgi:cytosine deaminase